LYVREVPEQVYGELKRRARQRGSSISREAIRLLARALEADRPEVRELLDEIRSHRPVAPRGSPSAADLLREDRDRK
jgi:plasmid stability protein